MQFGPRDQHRLGPGSPGRSPGHPCMGIGSCGPRLALALGSRRLTLVSNRAALAAAATRGVGRGDRASGRGPRAPRLRTQVDRQLCDGVDARAVKTRITSRFCAFRFPLRRPLAPAIGHSTVGSLFSQSHSCSEVAVVGRDDSTSPVYPGTGRPAPGDTLNMYKIIYYNIFIII